MASSSSCQEIVEYQQERSIASPKQYDAFISHRGPDVKDTLAKQLYDLLQARGCRAFLDREEIEGGDSIPFAIDNAICSSLVQIAIFSKGYAKSIWCLNELVLMLEQTDALFIPVFYGVEPWELRYIENEKSRYAAAFSDYLSKARYPDKLDEWKKALEFASKISGYELSVYKDNLCEKIVSRVVQEMRKMIPLHVAKYPVGLAELVQDFENSCSETARDKVKIVGIFGLGGSGKTTLARELFNRKRSDYDASCFLSDVRESHANRDLHSLQNQLLKDLFNEYREFRNVDEGIGPLEHRLGRARNWQFLIVLDDVDHKDQLDALLPEAMLSSGSLVIITTRDQSVLRGADVSCRYRMKGMDKDHAEELFCSHALRGRDPPIVYGKLVESFVEFCGGLPLSLKVLGAHVYCRNERYWELVLEKVKDIQPTDIMKRLKISFDGLDSQEKHIFMDIACFFNKEFQSDLRSKAILFWKASGWSAELALQTLIDKCLLEYPSLYPFQMHDHLRDLGRQMADDDKFGPRRMWRPNILRSMEIKGFKQILAETKSRCFHSFVDSSLTANITYFIGSPNDSAETDLLWLEISDLKKIPSWIPLRNLRYLVVERVEELWSTFQQQLQTNNQVSFELRNLEIRSSSSLQKLPDLIGKLSHLETLTIRGSLWKTDITSFTQSLERLSNLRSLQLDGGFSSQGDLNLSEGRVSTNFEASRSSRMNSLETIEFRGLVNISKLIISGEICPRFLSLEVEKMNNLYEIELKKTERLNRLIVRSCPELKRISGSSLAGLQLLCTTYCKGLQSLPNLANLARLERIKIGGSHQLLSIEGLEELQRLKSLQVDCDNKNAGLWNCLYVPRRLPSEYTLLRGKLLDGASCRFNVNLFSGVIDAEAVTEIDRCSWLPMSSSSNAITIYALLVKRGEWDYYDSDGLPEAYFTGLTNFPYKGEWMVTVMQAANCSFQNYIGSRRGLVIQKGFMATVSKGEEGKALTILQIIIDQLYRPTMVAADVAAEIEARESESQSISERESESESVV